MIVKIKSLEELRRTEGDVKWIEDVAGYFVDLDCALYRHMVPFPYFGKSSIHMTTYHIMITDIEVPLGAIYA